VKKHQINLLVDEKTLAIRRSHHKAPKLRVTNGVLYKYAKQVKTAADGCVTDED
jgi:dihydroxy-acid dehydratase